MSPLYNVLDVKLPSLVRGSHKGATGCVQEAQFVTHLLPELELLRRNILLYL